MNNNTRKPHDPGQRLWLDNIRRQMPNSGTLARYLHAIQRYTAADVSGRATQDVLLLAGSEDHCVPVEQFYKQIAARAQQG